MDDTRETFSELVNCPLWCAFDGCVIDRRQSPPIFSRKRKERSKIDLKASVLCGMAGIGDIFSCGGDLSLMLSQGTRRAWFVRSFSLISSAKCSIASGVVADLCGPRSTASHNSSFVQLRPVHVGQPNVAQSRKMSAVG
jgi:hypothetical protein